MSGLNLVVDFQETEMHVNPSGGYNFYKYKEIIYQNKFVYLESIFDDKKDINNIVIKDADSIIYCEGNIYNKSLETIKKNLKELGNYLTESTLLNNIRNWQNTIDGEYLIIYYDYELNKIFFINDLLGRLPVYYFFNNNKIIISRSMEFIKDNSEELVSDKYGIAQYLYFGYPLGEHTIFNGISRIREGSIIGINIEANKIRIEQESINLDFKTFDDINEITNELIDTFKTASINRSCKESNLLLLSGGLDSRAVAGALTSSNINYHSLTYNYKGSEEDVKMAEMIAVILKIPWDIYDITTLTGKDYSTLLKIKYGMDYLGDAFLIPFFEYIKTEYNGWAIFTGDGGDKLLPSLKPSSKLLSDDELVEYIMVSKGNISYSIIQNALEMSISDFKHNIYLVIKNYPEENLDNKFIHFLIFERAFKFLFEAEDRNRYFFNSVTPFYSLPFFKLAMQVPEKDKKNYNLYKNFLLKLSPETISINNAFWKSPLTSNRFMITMLLKEYFYDKLPYIIKIKIKNRMHGLKKSGNAVLLSLLNKQLEDEKLNIFNKNYLKNLEFSDLELNYLLTITSIIEEVNYGTNIFTKNSNCII